MPKLLEFVSEKGWTHQQVMDYLKDYKPPDESEDEEEEEVVDNDDQTTDDKDDTSTDDNEDKTELIQLSKDEITEMITKAIEEKFKANRKSPPKGKKTDKKVDSNRHVVKRSPFEIIV